MKDFEDLETIDPGFRSMQLGHDHLLLINSNTRCYCLTKIADGSSLESVKYDTYTHEQAWGCSITDWDDLSFLQLGGAIFKSHKTTEIPMNFIYSAITGETIKLPKLKLPCYEHSSCRTKKKIYIFGGDQGFFK